MRRHDLRNPQLGSRPKLESGQHQQRLHQRRRQRVQLSLLEDKIQHESHLGRHRPTPLLHQRHRLQLLTLLLHHWRCPPHPRLLPQTPLPEFPLAEGSYPAVSGRVELPSSGDGDELW